MIDEVDASRVRLNEVHDTYLDCIITVLSTIVLHIDDMIFFLLVAALLMLPLQFLVLDLALLLVAGVYRLSC